ncbi:YicC/YloC family endoribonuclease [uncultured Eubacterium sp.]|uniref:YicC/YloC family endoribonuclease n=1 Tax=uncultured Eubacterium sp. TaxID=165185 RepID=UPI0025DF5873|nr:YicC/YloC family endoribonuclease [uncultured Eubacterium sp.]
MIKSMTGFGRCELSNDKRKITVELKSVNHRYLDINIRMPKKLNFFEAAIRNLLKEYMQRGKVDVFISYEDFSEQTMAVKYNAAIAREYLGYLQQMADELNLENDIRVSTLSRYPEVLTMEEQTPDEEELWSQLEQAIRNACTQFSETRAVEGTHLKQDLVEKLHHMKSNVDKVEERAPEIIKEYRAKLGEKVQELLGDTQIDEARLSTEIILFADKICTDEETVRLKSHITSMLNALDGNEGIGRKLDFIAQEMNREANTILSKSNDLETSDIAIELKTEIEKVREQIQNIE